MNVLEITTRIGCPVNCTYCPQSTLVKAYRRRGGKFEMDMKTFIECINKVPESVTIGFCGMCEPWANSSCTDMLLYTAEKKHHVFIDTTLRGMSIKDFEAVCKVKLDFFAVHLPSEGNHEQIPITEEYKEIIKRIRGGALQANYVDLNYYGGRLHPELHIPEAKRNPVLTRSGNIDVSERKAPARLAGRLKCRRALRQNHLLPNGDVILCSADYGLKHILGNLTIQSYEDLFTSNEFRRIEEGLDNEHSDTICRTCDSYYRNANTKAFIINNVNNLKALRPEGIPTYMKATGRRILYKIRHIIGLTLR